VCLGHQLLAEAIGGKVAPARKPEIGLLTVNKTSQGNQDPALRSISNPILALQWHGAEVLELPNGTSVLASSRGCPIQSFRYGDYAYGLQFHIEVTEQTVSEWASIPACAGVLATMGAGALQRLKDEVDVALPQLNPTAREIYDNLKDVWFG
jgi:GMP synthase-like glutamine amidotransferase